MTRENSIMPSKVYEHLRENSLRILEERKTGRKDMECLKFLFQENGLIATVEAADRAKTLGFTVGDFVLALVYFQAMEMSLFANMLQDGTNKEVVAVTLGDTYTKEILQILQRT